MQKQHNGIIESAFLEFAELLLFYPPSPATNMSHLNNHLFWTMNKWYIPWLQDKKRTNKEGCLSSWHDMRSLYFAHLTNQLHKLATNNKSDKVIRSYSN